MKARRNTYPAAIAAVVACFCVPAAGWACTGQPQVVALSADRAPVGTQVTVIGQRVPTDYVEIRWDSLDGKVVAAGRAVNGDFAIAAEIPEASPGVYYLVVSATPAGDPQGVATITRVSFEVTASPAVVGRQRTSLPGVRSVSEDLWTGLVSPASVSRLGAVSENARAQAIPALGIGLGMLFFGSVALLGAVVTALAHKRRTATGRSTGD